MTGRNSAQVDSLSACSISAVEALGGGGHRTVAGAQLQGMTIEEAKQAILEHALEALHSAEQEEE